MAVNRKISAASARAHTRKAKQGNSFRLPSGLLRKISLVLLVGLFAWAYQSIQPPPPRICGSPGGPKITSSRIKLNDGRHLAYKEHGVANSRAKHKIIYVHGFDSCRHDALPASQELMEELGVYMVSFDRTGYGESDPNPKRTVKSMAFDIEELADQLEMGTKFYVIGFSMGGQIVWSCLKYIPHRLAGAALVAPVINFWWPGLPANVSQEGFDKQLEPDKWAVRVAHYAPWLSYWWNTQKWFPYSNVVAHSPLIFSASDKKLLPRFEARKEYEMQIRQQGISESLCSDMKIGFGSWEFSPTDLENPFPNNEGSVHLWHGDDDLVVPVGPQRYIAEKLPWIHYHEVAGAGHMFILEDGFGSTDRIILDFLEFLPLVDILFHEGSFLSDCFF
ncbi:hypothetical protein H6P81_003667 [Aristolochia fimbriata]|uniref:AB hydrolase-1 domain-containing protein n=1 Tax=Aristolochia fimbriata TaxID=158543 RepID=A0AAV7FF68_ARIFI|nr:hypothetical protein H6P81_003667 [Aristolochia fimbriata]